MTTIYRAEIETRHFHFEAFDVTPEAALASLVHGLEKHAARAGDMPATWAAETAADARVMPFALGACYRDREAI
jgi:hypothetical protein